MHLTLIKGNLLRGLGFTYMITLASRCMLNTIDGPSEQVEDYLCDPEEMPLGARNSQLPCPEDCVLSDWGPWSPCPLVRQHVTFSVIARQK